MKLPYSLKILRDWEIFYNSVLVWFILTVMLTYANLATIVGSNSGPLFDFILTRNYINIFRGSLGIRQETE